MSRYVAISKTNCHGHGWQPLSSYSFAAQTSCTPVLAEELPVAIATLPIAFRRQVADKISFELVSVLSLLSEANFFIDSEGAWIGGYIPAEFRKYPFSVIYEKDTKNMVLCIDKESGLYTENPGPNDYPFFDATGEPSAVLAKTIEFFKKLEKQRRLTQNAVDALTGENLIEPWNPAIHDKNGNLLPFEGFFRIDEMAMSKLDKESLERIHKSGAMAIAYAQLLSQPRIKGLARLYQHRDQLSQKQKSSRLDLDKFFGQDDIFNYKN